MRPNIQGFQSKADLLWVSRGLRRGRDAYPMDSRFKIPAPLVIRTAGTREGKQSREWNPVASEVGVELANPLYNPKT